MELSEPLEEGDTSELPVAPEGELRELKLSDPVPLRVPVRVEEPLPETEPVCVTVRDTTVVLEAVGAPELVFETEGDAVYVVEPVLVRELVCEPVVVVVPEEERETEGVSDHSALVEGCADAV